MRTIPVDLILHSLLDLLRAVPADTPGTYAEALALCIDHRRVAEEWQADGVENAAHWLMGRLNPKNPAIVSTDANTRTIEVAIARRLADVAFSLTIEQTPEATAHATTLLRAAQAIVGLASGEACLAGSISNDGLSALAPLEKALKFIVEHDGWTLHPGQDIHGWLLETHRLISPPRSR